MDEDYEIAFDGAHDALNRMRRAHERGTGCHLTADMIRSLSVTLIGQMWSDDDPRQETST
ncbi:hypothetical protein GURKE_00800 [Brevundimonas phage vB_BpoS-Gurke]|uniref:Uncharacterized protein n=1 Tax=Brevundimonas phage vB_BpoS-Gurke TaxID=2948599 RepID=A0A9E7N4M6_9CAUD|nr:hypothetical protein GURKE_00800 [Brevundimonas phage vB_BpoS-Gurke]